MGKFLMKALQWCNPGKGRSGQTPADFPNLLKSSHVRTESEDIMSALTDFFKALLKDAEAEEQTNTEPPKPTEPPKFAEPKPAEPPKSADTDEVERLKKELEEAQKLNRELLNRADVTNNQSTDFSEIMREQSYHPLYTERR